MFRSQKKKRENQKGILGKIWHKEWQLTKMKEKKTRADALNMKTERFWRKMERSEIN